MMVTWIVWPEAKVLLATEQVLLPPRLKAMVKLLPDGTEIGKLAKLPVLPAVKLKSVPVQPDNGTPFTWI